MNLDWSPEDLQFRDEVRAFLDEKLTPDLRRAGRLMTSVYPDHEASMGWQAILHERGWAAPAWPVDDGEDLVCTGSKIWTTHATEANWIFCLVRTKRTEKKQEGITFVLMDMDTSGIEIRPLVMTSGEEVQNQVFFDSVRVPKANVL